jgi:purine-binding chemotaxis protein CheW
MDILKSRQDQYIRFILEDIRLAIPLQSALEIGHRPEITPLPNLPEWVLGVSNIRGEIISIVDLKGFFRMKTHGLKRDSRFIILYNREIKTGIIVDRVLGLLTLDRLREEIRTNPYAEGEISHFISEVVVYEDHLLNILDVDKLLSSPRMDAFRGE